MERKQMARALASVMLSGPLHVDGAVERWTRLLGSRRRWLEPLARRVARRFKAGARPRHFRVERFILNDEGFQRAWKSRPMSVAAGPDEFPPVMCPASGPPAQWAAPEIVREGDLARLLNLSANELNWFADCRALEQKTAAGPLRHYRYQWRIKRNGSVRLIEAPKPRLKAIQQWVLHEILDRIPPHPAAHGFRSGRSIRTFVEPHIGRDIVLKLDLKDFFPGILRARVLAIFLTAGYPERVADLLTGLCTNAVPPGVIRGCPAEAAVSMRRLRDLYGRPHLPQGAPVSPALANLAAYRLDCRLAGLARSMNAAYSRYADDLVFSGDKTFGRSIDRFYVKVAATAIEEGFEVNTRKTRIMRSSLSQRAAGVVLNARPNVAREDYDRLKAILHNCAVHGPSGQNRSEHGAFRAHLMGRLAHVEMLNPRRAERLRAVFERIDWR